MRNHPLDELIADYIGIVAAAGRFRADWFLHFMGIEGFPVYRSGGWLENYRGEPPLSDPAFRILQGSSYLPRNRSNNSPAITPLCSAGPTFSR